MQFPEITTILVSLLSLFGHHQCHDYRLHRVPAMRGQTNDHSNKQSDRTEMRQRHITESTTARPIQRPTRLPAEEHVHPSSVPDDGVELISGDEHQYEPSIDYQDAIDSEPVIDSQPTIDSEPVLSPDHDTQEPDQLNCTNDTAIINDLLRNYNKHKLPDPKGVTVKVEFWVQEISSVSEISNDFEMDIYINEMWLDKELAYKDWMPCKQNISLSHQVFDQLWTPNSCFINSKEASIHDSPFRNIFLMIYPNGTVWTNYRVKVKGPCDMDLSKFPMDVQRCSLIYESFSYNRAEVRMQWGDLEKPVYALKNFTLPDFVLTDMANSSGTVVYPAGQWDELYATFTFQRRYMWYILQAYIPTYLTIFISWISFTLGPKAIPARTMLGVNSLLAMIMMFGNIMKSLPRVSYVKAIDVWMLACMTFNFCSLLELAIVGYMTKDPSPCRRASMAGPSISGLNATGNASPSPANVATSVGAVFGASARYMTGKKLCKHYHPNRLAPHTGVSNGQKVSLAHERAMNRYIFADRKSTGCLRNCMNVICPPIWTAEKIDKASCFAFPVLFSLFNIAYWSYYTQT